MAIWFHAGILVVFPSTANRVTTYLGVPSTVLIYMIHATVIINSLLCYSHNYSSFAKRYSHPTPGRLVPLTVTLSACESECSDSLPSGWCLLGLLQSFLWTEMLGI